MIRIRKAQNHTDPDPEQWGAAYRRAAMRILTLGTRYRTSISTVVPSYFLKLKLSLFVTAGYGRSHGALI
jgi:hypothetical protein